MADYKFYAFFSAVKQGKTGLTIAVDVYDSVGNIEVADGVGVEIGGGLYTYVFPSLVADDYTAIFKTTDLSVDSQHIPALATKQLVDYIDMRVSDIPADVWDIDISTYPNGTAGAVLNNTCTIGTGSVEWEYSVTEPDMVTPIPDVTVRVTTDLAGANTIAMGTTDMFGKVTFFLDPGTYYLWSYKVYVSFTNPDVEVVT